MKSRSHRLPTSDSPDDWVDGSWTVDCVCGVNFDDGEEMVNCDECGVWVHTRCSRYVKSEKSFACDKCKSKNTRNDSEETEVAQLLVELPTKTLRMDNPYPLSGCPPRRPFRLWTDIPIEERVHVQGIPGGEPTLFGGLPAIFTPELWKCTGHVPKKFNFQYREFPCWDEKPESNAKVEEEIENPVDKGAGVLFSLSKENVPATHVQSLTGMKRQVDGGGGGGDKLAPSKDMKKWEGENIDARHAQDGVKKDKTLLRPFVIHSGKRKKEDSGASKDQSGKKKVRVVDREGDAKKRAPQASKTASTLLSSDAKQLEFYEEKGPKSVKTDTHCINNVDLRDTLPKDILSDSRHVAEHSVDRPKDNLASGEHPSVALVSDVSGHNISIGTRLMEDKTGHQVSACPESSKTENGMASLYSNNDPVSVPIKEEDVGVGLDSVNDNGGGSFVNAGIGLHKLEPVVEHFSSAVAEIKDNQNCQDPSGDNSLEPGAKVNTEADFDHAQGAFNAESSTLSDIKLDDFKPLVQQSGASADLLSANVEINDTAATSLQSSDLKVQDVDRSAEAVRNCQTDTASEFSCDPSQPKQQLDELEGSIAMGRSSSELEHDSRAAEEPSKLSSTVVSPPASLSQRKMAASVGKSSSTSSTIMISKPPVSDNRKPTNAQNHNPIMKRGTPDCSIITKSGSTDVVRGEDRHEMPRKILKERSKSSVSSVLKASHSSRISHASDSKKTVSDSKDRVLYSSFKTSSAQNIGPTPGSGDPASSLQTQSASLVQNKISASGLQQRSEKVNQSNTQPSTKVNHAVQMQPPAPSNSPATLSDEELALLLHQELNSSPRVPRVPRMRHTGSLPQLASPTATSMLIKKTSSSGGRDHSLVARRKSKDIAKDGSRSSREIDDEAKMDRLPLSPDQRRHDSTCPADVFNKRESDSGSGKGLHAVKRSAPVSTVTVSSGPSSSTEVNEQNLSSMHNSPQNASEDDTGTIGGPTHRTLPGLIAEIMSKGKRMTYDELCNAVLPHWPNLRKHNGERYAYSSHSQAVLDCLRNRYEWAQLVDRGPKTNASKKRRKLDAEAPSFESEDNVCGKDTTSKEVEGKSFESHREEFPKGKRKARKRRRLALQGRGIKDVRRRRKADMLSDDDVVSFSSSSEESLFSDEEIQGGGACPVGSEASTSSDEMTTMS